MNTPILPVFTALLLALTVTTGCGKKEEATVATQVAAIVNGDEITVHQINNVLARSQNITSEVSVQAKREILHRLVDQQLVRQKAIEKNLDRSPIVIQSIEVAKSEILARAYLEQIAAALPQPAPWEIEKYYVEHPELFAKRRLFDIEEIVLVAKDDVAAGLREQVSRARSMQEIADWLRAHGTSFAVNYGVRAADQIALEILPTIQAMKDGQIQLHDAGGGRLEVIRLAASRAEPLDEATAAPRIGQFLLNRRSSEMITKEMKQIKEQAKIKYIGEFAADGTAQEMKAEAEAKASAFAKARAKGQTTDAQTK